MIKKNREMASKKRQAVHLFVVKGYPQNEIARILGVSEKTICLWGKKYQWHDKITNDFNLEGGVSTLMKRFFEYVKDIKPESVDSFKTLWNAFLKQEEINFNN